MNSNIIKKKILCENLYKEYLELKKKTYIAVNDHIPGQTIVPSHINLEDLLRKEEVRQQLLDCKDCLELGAGDWFEIENG